MKNEVFVKELVPEGGWLQHSSPRLSPLADGELSLGNRSILYMMLKIGGAKCPNLFRTLLRNARVYLPFARFNSTIMPRGKIKRRNTELAILRVAWKSRSYYEWGQHVEMGMRTGLSPEDIYRVTLGFDAQGWSHLEKAILCAVDEIIDNRQLSNATWKRLSAHLNEKQMIELLFLISGYGALACVLNSVGVQLEPEVQQVLIRTKVSCD